MRGGNGVSSRRHLRGYGGIVATPERGGAVREAMPQSTHQPQRVPAVRPQQPGPLHSRGQEEDHFQRTAGEGLVGPPQFDGRGLIGTPRATAIATSELSNWPFCSLFVPCVTPPYENDAP